MESRCSHSGFTWGRCRSTLKIKNITIGWRKRHAYRTRGISFVLYLRSWVRTLYAFHRSFTAAPTEPHPALHSKNIKLKYCSPLLICSWFVLGPSVGFHHEPRTDLVVGCTGRQDSGIFLNSGTHKKTTTSATTVAAISHHNTKWCSGIPHLLQSRTIFKGSLWFNPWTFYFWIESVSVSLPGWLLSSGDYHHCLLASKVLLPKNKCISRRELLTAPITDGYMKANCICGLPLPLGGSVFLSHRIQLHINRLPFLIR